MIGDHLRRQLQHDPYQSIAWDLQVGATLWAPDAPGELYTDVTQALPIETRKRLDHRKVCYALVDQRMNACGVTADAADRERLARAGHPSSIQPPPVIDSELAIAPYFN
ncbi:MAG: hypothetical protein JWQ94_1471 [Tardiphaga sp.]|jgi:hypothetical protein|nr:hypothetical protein [Tardiphaga sp.]